MKAEIKNIDGIDCIIITAPMQQPQLSSTKKSYLVANSSGAKRTDATVNGKTVSVNVTAFIPV